MDPMRIMQAEAPHIRQVFRRVRHALRDEHDRLEAAVSARMPAPAASMTLRVLTTMKRAAGGIDSLLSEIMHGAFPEDAAPAQAGTRAGRETTAVHPDAPSLLDLVATRLGADRSGSTFRAGERSLLSLEAEASAGRLTAEGAAAFYCRLAKNEADKALRLSVFAGLLVLLTPPEENVPRDILAKRAVDLSRALKDEIDAGDDVRIANLLRKYAAHV